MRYVSVFFLSQFLSQNFALIIQSASSRFRAVFFFAFAALYTAIDSRTFNEIFIKSANLFNQFLLHCPALSMQIGNATHRNEA